jgi:hypothetical protein
MPLNTIRKLLDWLYLYRYSDITHTFSENEIPIVSVCYITLSGYYQLIYLNSLSIQYFSDVESATLAINEIIKNVEINDLD